MIVWSANDAAPRMRAPGTTERAQAAYLRDRTADVLADGRSAVMLDALQDCLRGHFDVDHSTFQLELAGHADHERPMHN